jgi:hypothetical protein
MNTAARLENFAKDVFAPDPNANPCRIFVGEPTMARLGDRFETELVGDVSLKGKTQSVGIYRVLGRMQVQAAHQEEEDSDARLQNGRTDLARNRDDASRTRPVSGTAASAAAERGGPEPGRGPGDRSRL